MLLARVRAAAEVLVVELDQARRASRAWADERSSDALVEAALSACLGRLAESGCWGEANRLPSGELWRIAGPLLETGVLQRHARFKPRGYAGDYEMLHWICTNYCCDDPLGRVFDRYFQRQAAPAAVRSRTEQTAAALADHCRQSQAGIYQVLSVGAGPAEDLRGALARLPADCRLRLRATLLDLDPEALEFARGRLLAFLPSESIRTVRENLYRLPRHARCQDLVATPDALVCSGLFDYLDDAVAVEMLRLFWQRLAQRGLLVVGNFSSHNPTRAYMEWIGNWYLTYRTADQLRWLAGQAGIPAEEFTIDVDSQGAQLLLTARKGTQ